MRITELILLLCDIISNTEVDCSSGVASVLEMLLTDMGEDHWRELPIVQNLFEMLLSDISEG